jgi:hypothetical protein
MYAAPQIHLKTLIDTLRLTICLRVVGSASQQCGIVQFEQFPPEITCKNLVPVRNNGWWHPWSLSTTSNTTWATCLVENGCFSGRKWAYLENLSTITRMELNPSGLGNPYMKFMVISCQAPAGMGSGCNNPT